MIERLARRVLSESQAVAFGQFVRTALVGCLNTVFAHGLLTFFQFYLFAGVPEAWRTDLSFSVEFVILVTFSFYVNRVWSFKLDARSATLREYLTFASTNVLSVFAPVAVWNVLEAAYGMAGVVQFNLVTLAVAVAILPIKFAAYRLFVFRSALRDH